MSKRTTIEDVARMAGCGKVTVSYVLNGRSKVNRISEQTQKRILAAAKELQYRPNAIARSLVTRRTDTLAVVFQSGGYFNAWSSFTSEVMRGISEVTVAENCDLMLHTKQARDPDEEAHALSDGRVDGALILRDERDPTLLKLVDRGFPCVQFFTHNRDLDIPWVDCNNLEGGKIATQHLIDLGHRKIGMVYGSPGSVSSQDRVLGFQNCMASHQLDARSDWMVEHANPGDHPEKVLSLFESKDRPTALFVWSDDVAITIAQALKEKNIKIPSDVSLVGFDSALAAESYLVPLTSVRQPVREMAAAATQLLINLVRNETVSNKLGFLHEPVLDIRASTGIPG